ncbi:MAG: amidohydrolase [Clostridium sp.]|nr:amidohydrolase [Clostridium sp.]
MNIEQATRYYYDYLIELRRHFHAHPEVSEQEYETSKRIKQELDTMGIPWRPCGLDTGVLAEIHGGRPGRTTLLRADMDALAVREETGLPFSSQAPGVMHACGHDCHTASLLTAARILKDMQEELCGTVRLAFQPAEETAEGAKAMIGQGALEGVDSCFAIHVWSDIAAGKVGLNVGPQMAAADMFTIDIEGKGGHGSAPHQGTDAVIAACAMVNNLQTIVSREIAPLTPAVLTVGRLEAGTRCNVIAEHARLEGTTRYFTPDLIQRFPEMMERVVTMTAQTFRAKASMRYLQVMPPAVNDSQVAQLVLRAAETILGPGAAGSVEPVTAGEDFAYFMEKVPGAVAFVGVGDPACGAVWPQHSGRFVVNEAALVNSVKLYVQAAMELNKK